MYKTTSQFNTTKQASYDAFFSCAKLFAIMGVILMASIFCITEIIALRVVAVSLSCCIILIDVLLVRAQLNNTGR